MAEGVVARKIANFIRPIVMRLQEARNRRMVAPDSAHIEMPQMDLPFMGVPGFDSAWSGNVSDIDYFRTGLTFMEGSMWDLDAFEETQGFPKDMSQPMQLDPNFQPT